MATRKTANRRPITAAVVQNLKPAKEPYILWDTNLAGFGIYVGKRGASWVVQHRDAGGRLHKRTIAKVSAMNLKDARAAASAFIDDADEGEVRPLATVADLVEQFLSVEVPNRRRIGKMAARTEIEYRRQIDRYLLPALGGHQVAKVRRRDVEAMVLPLAPIVRNRVLALTHRLFKKAADWEWIAPGRNPASGVDKTTEIARDRLLSADEMKRLGDALDSLDSPAPVAAIRFLALVGLRVSEALAVQWKHVDMETGKLLLPETKTGRRWHTLPAPALALLDGIDRKGAFVFTTTGAAPITYRTVRKHFAEACERAGIEGARLHDLRRGVVSAAARAGESVPVLQALLGHRTSTQALKYAAQMDTTAEAARSRVAAEMAEAMGYDAENVVPLHKTA